MEIQEEKPVVEGIEIPQIREVVKLPEFEERELRTLSVRYPLIPRSGKPRVFAEAHIFFDERTHEFVYYVIEPELTTENRELLLKIKEFIQEKIDVDFTKLRKRDAIRYMINLFEDALSYFKVRKSPRIEEVMKYYVFRDFIGLERIEPLLKDPNLEDISCDGVGIPIYVYHKDPRFGSMRTNIKFDSSEELDRFVMKLAERCGKTISIASPLLDGTLPDGSRVQATLASDIARRGSNFTIRKFTEKPLTPVDLLRFGTCDLTLMSYFWMVVEYGCSILISGGTASGKTTLLNVLSMFIKPQLKVISIEDTAELKLAHPHWVSHVSRVPIAVEKREVDLFELLRASLRQRPDYLIVGEVRGREAYVLFQQIALGHAALATIHAESFSKLVDRLTTPPISLPASLLQNLDLVIFIERVRKKDKFVRRITSVDEIMGYSRRMNTPIPNKVFKWNPVTDTFEIKNKSILLKKIADRSGLSERDIKKEMEDRAKVLLWMTKRNITDYKEITKIVNMFYLSRDYLLDRISLEV
jgi:flagellar protein FlaI